MTLKVLENQWRCLEVLENGDFGSHRNLLENTRVVWMRVCAPTSVVSTMLQVVNIVSATNTQRYLFPFVFWWKPAFSLVVVFTFSGFFQVLEKNKNGPWKSLKRLWILPLKVCMNPATLCGFLVRTEWLGEPCYSMSVLFPLGVYAQ